MPMTAIIPPGSGKPLAPYSPGVMADGVVYVSGTLPFDKNNDVVHLNDPAAQTRHVLDLIKSVIAAAGGTMADVTFNSIFLTDWAHYGAINTVYAEYFPGDKPARYCIQCGLVKPGALVEIATVAHLGRSRRPAARLSDIHAEVTGEDRGGGTVLLSSGLGGAAAFWAPQLDALGRDYRVVAYDQRGTGRSPGRLPTPYAIGNMAADVIEVMDMQGIAQCHFVGHALGGLVGLELALQAPARVQTLTLVNAWARADRHTLRCFDIRLDLLRHVGPEAYVRAQPLFLFPAPWLSANADRIEAEHVQALAHFQGTDTLLARIAALRAFDVSDRLPEIRCPVLVSASRDDLLVPWTASQALAEGVPDARLWVVPEGGHAFTVTEPDAFNTALLAFLSEHRP